MTKNISDFLNKELVDYASYDNLRKIASVMDGLKNSGRKVISTVIDLNIKDNLKVLQLSNKAAERAEYLHGSLDGVVVNLAKDYAGTNNLPLLQKKGNFGTRFNPEASAPRYIFARKKDYLDELFLKEDSLIVPEQYFEGSKIEPKFFVPTLPLLLVNGSNGISSGFAQLILSRDPKEIRDYLVKTISSKEPKNFPMPSFNGFEGNVSQGVNPNQFIISGKVKRKSANRVLIEEVPFQYDLRGYIDVLDKLEEDKKIHGYTDLSDESFKFEVQIPSKILSSLNESELLDYLKLTRTVSENYTSLTHENKIKEYQSPKEIMSDYIQVKLEYVQKRKDYILNELNSKLDLMNSRFKFISAVVNDELVLSKRKKDDIILDIDSLNVTRDGTGTSRYDYLLRMSISSLTKEELDKLKLMIEEVQTNMNNLNKKSPKDIWLEDINRLKI